MTEEVRPIRCHFGRVDLEPCMEPATVEIVGPTPTLLCEEHARHRFEEDKAKPTWWLYSADDEVQYARWCEEAADALRAWWDDPGAAITLEGPLNHVLEHALEEAATYLECYELRRARAALIKSGEAPRPTVKERSMLEFFHRSAKEFGWTDKPPWVERVEAWLAAEGSEAREA
jgi:hypothetical protein